LEYSQNKQTPKKKTIILRVQPEVKTKIEDIAYLSGIPASALARIFILKGIQEKEKENKMYKAV